MGKILTRMKDNSVEIQNIFIVKLWQDHNKISQDLSKIFSDIGKILANADKVASFYQIFSSRVSYLSSMQYPF